MAMGKHYGAFAKGFSDSILAVMKLKMMQEHQDALLAHYRAQEALWSQRLGKGKGLTPEQIAAGQQAGRDWDAGGTGAGGGGQPSRPATGSWWTPERMQHAADRLVNEAGFTKAGAAGVVGRWSGIEAPAGPASSNDIGGGHWGIGQWDRARGGPDIGKASFDDQLTHAINEFNGPEKVAGDVLRNAKTPEEGARGASMYERASGYDASTGRDNFTDRTPAGRVFATVYGGAPAQVAGATPGTTGSGSHIEYLPDEAHSPRIVQDKGPNDIYRNITVKDSQGRDQIPMFTRWNPDPVGNEASNLKQLNPDMQKVIAKARADNPDLKFVLGNGKRSAADQDWAKSVGWSQVGSKDGGDAAVHMKGQAADLWPLDKNGYVTFDPDAQAKVTAAIKQAAKETGVKINAGDDWRHPDKPHFELAAPTTAAAKGAPTKGPDKGKVAQAAPEGPPVLHDASSADALVAREQTAQADTPVSTGAGSGQPFKPYQVAGPWEGPPSSATPETSQPLTPPSRGPTGDPAAAMEEANRAATRAGIPAQPMMPPRTPTPPPTTTQLGPESPYAPPDVRGATLSPSDQPSSGVGVSAADTYGPLQRTGAPPTVGITPSSVGDTSLNASPRMPPRTTTPATAYPASQRQGPNQPTEADKPAPVVQPISSSAIPSTAVTPAGDTPGFVQVTAPNANPTGRGSDRQMTALDLSHLWGPNPPLSQRAATPAPAPTPPRPQDDGSDWSNVASAPDMSDVSAGMAMGAAKGGPIQRFQRGGIPKRPTFKFAAGGAAPVSSQYPSYTPAAPAPTPGLQGNVLAADQYMTGLPGMTAVDLTDYGPAYYDAYGAGSINGLGGVQLGQDYSQMTPSQVSQYNAMLAGTWTPPAATPAAAPASTPAPPPVVAPTSQNITAPAATTTITDPTTTTTTGAPGLPSSITAKSYDPNVDQQTGASFANTSNTGGTNYSVASTDLLNQTTPGTISGSRKGGPIRRYAQGGGIPARPTMKLAAGGAPGGAAAQMAQWANYSGPTDASGGWTGTPYAQMAPNQQAWANQQQSLFGQLAPMASADYAAGMGGASAAPQDTSGLLSQFTGTPEAIWPTAAPAAPAPLNEPAPSASTITSPSASSTITDPTTTTTTGAPGLPNGIQAKSYDPNVDQQTGAGFANTSNVGGTNYSVGSTDLLNQTTPGTISGSRKGGPISRNPHQLTPRVTSQARMRYDDGGGVSPSAAGMPPGLGGAAPIPPIYYNPATYAGAGAPVGKGITSTSAPTYNAGAIPSLPMARGGVVRRTQRFAGGGMVQAYDDGGDVGSDLGASNDEYAMARDDQMTSQLLDQRDAQATADSAPITSLDAPARSPDWAYSPADFQTQPTQGATQPVSQQGPPSGAAPWTPEISDGAGNPSKGLIAAIGDGLHWLGAHLGLTGGGPNPAVASDPQIQTNRANFVAKGQNVGGYDQNQQQQAENIIVGSNSGLNAAERQLAVMEGTYKYMLSQGDTAGAGRMAAGILQYSVQTSQQYAEEAAKQLYDGNLKGAVDNINHASDAVPDGRLVHATLNDDGTVTVQNKTLDGRVLWQQKGSAEAILQYATNRGRTGQMQWNALESQAAKYDSTFARMQANRQKNQYAQGQEDQATAANQKFAPTLRPLTPAGNQPAAPAIAPTPQAAPITNVAAPEITPTQTAQNAPIVNLSGTSPITGGALPPTATASNINPNAPAPQSQEVALERDVGRYQNIEASTRSNYFTPSGNPIINGQELAPPDQSQIRTPADAAAYRQADADYRTQWNRNNALLKADVDGQRRDLGTSIAEQRRALAESATQGRLDQREQFTQDQTTSRAQNQMKFDAWKEVETRKYANVKPLDDGQLRDEIDPNRGGTPLQETLASALLPPDQAEAVKQGRMPADQALGQTYSKSELNTIGQAVWNGRKYTHDTTIPATAELIGGVLNGSYKVQPPEPMGDVGDGVARTKLTITRPNGTAQTLVLPEQDASNVKALWTNKAAIRQAAADKQAKYDADTARAKTSAGIAARPELEQMRTPGSRYDVAPQPSPPVAQPNAPAPLTPW